MVRVRCFSAAAPLCLCSFFSTHSFAGLRALDEDAVVVRRSELIVVGRLKRGSVKYVPHKHVAHPTIPGNPASWEHHAMLTISEVLKGKTKENEMTIVLRYGLDPAVGGHLETDVHPTDGRGHRKDHPRKASFTNHRARHVESQTTQALRMRIQKECSIIRAAA